VRTEENVRQTGEPNTLVIAASGAVFALALLAGIFALQAYYYRAEDDENARKVVAVAPEELAQARAQQAEQIHAYRWIDRSKGVVGIPVEEAMDLVVREGAGPLASPTAPGAPTAGKVPPSRDAVPAGKAN
jgi:hypothetical protein